MYTENTWNTRNGGYLREFETKIDNILGYLSGAQKSSFGQTTLNQKNLCKCAFKHMMRVNISMNILYVCLLSNTTLQVLRALSCSLSYSSPPFW
jgi:hypothetical protein